MIIKDVKNIIFDNNCIICKNTRLSIKVPFICEKCLSSFNRTIDNKCKICSHPLDDFNNCPSCFKLGEIYFDSYNFIQYYTDYFKTIIYKLKIQEDFMINILFFYLIKIKNLIKNNVIITVVPDTFFKRIRKGRSSLFYLRLSHIKNMIQGVQEK